MSARLDVLVPTCDRPAALAVTLAGLVGQRFEDFRLVVSDQGDRPARVRGEVRAVLRALAQQGRAVEVHRHLPRRGMAEQREFLLTRATAPYAVFVDDDLVLEPDLLARLLTAIEEEGCGFVGCMPIGLSYRGDVRPDEHVLELWEGRVEPEEVMPGSETWARHRLHNAANVLHVAERFGITKERPARYRVAWIGGCVLYDVDALRAVGGFGFWRELPPKHAGEDVLAQLRVMARFGACGLLPSGVYHQELATTLAERDVDAPLVLALHP